MLTADAFGVLPPIAKLSAEAAMYHFLSGYTAKVAGTEKGVKDPSATFSTCFGAPFLPLNPNVYARALGERIARHKSRVWLVNTGWTGGPFGVGKRMSIAYTRAMIAAALSGALDSVSYQRHPVFNLEMPTSCPGVPAEVLDPRSTWSDKAAYDTQARKLAAMFVDNFKTFAGDVDAAVVSAGPVCVGRAASSKFKVPSSRCHSCSLNLATRQLVTYLLMSHLRARHRAGDPRAAADGDENLLRLPHEFRRAAEHARLSRCAWGFPARCRS